MKKCWLCSFSPFHYKKITAMCQHYCQNALLYASLLSVLSIFRKRKASSPLEEIDINIDNSSNVLSTTKSSWDQTEKILHTMGLDFLSQGSTDSCASSENTENTPAVFVKDENSHSSSSSFQLRPVPGVSWPLHGLPLWIKAAYLKMINIY